jgi:hypothetical protein
LPFSKKNSMEWGSASKCFFIVAWWSFFCFPPDIGFTTNKNLSACASGIVII